MIPSQPLPVMPVIFPSGLRTPESALTQIDFESYESLKPLPIQQKSALTQILRAIIMNEAKTLTPEKAHAH